MRKRESCRFGLTLSRGPLLKHAQRFVERFNSRVDDLQFLVQIIEAGEFGFDGLFACPQLSVRLVEQIHRWVAIHGRGRLQWCLVRRL